MKETDPYLMWVSAEEAKGKAFLKVRSDNTAAWHDLNTELGDKFEFTEDEIEKINVLRLLPKEESVWVPEIGCRLSDNCVYIMVDKARGGR